MPKTFTRQQIISTIQAIAKKLKRNPSFEQVRRAGITPVNFYRQFPGMRAALAAAGLRPEGPGFEASVSAVLLDWAAVARKLKLVPGLAEYRQHGRFSRTPFARRFGSWGLVAQAFPQFAEQEGIESEWSDVLDLIASRYSRALGARIPQPAPVPRNVEVNLNQGRKRLRPDRPVYGDPLPLPGLAHAPVNEAGVIYLFGTLARKLGFVVQRIQPDFPDCEALREVEPGKWQQERIEFEFASRNFLQHGHGKDGCDLIVCWVHNWPECPANLEVIELRKIVRTL